MGYKRTAYNIKEDMMRGHAMLYTDTTNLNSCTNIDIHIYIHIYRHICNTYLYTYLHIYIHIYIHITYIYIHIKTNFNKYIAELL